MRQFLNSSSGKSRKEIKTRKIHRMQQFLTASFAFYHLLVPTNPCNRMETFNRTIYIVEYLSPFYGIRIKNVDTIGPIHCVEI